jgi:trans-aconitate methyltransferase
VNANSWDADAYDARFGFVARYGDDLVDALDPRPGQLVLDLGCGTGRHAAAMTLRGARVVGMDADPAMLARARSEHPEVRFVEADATQFDLGILGAERPFDGCLSNAALHWMTEQAPVLHNVRSVLRSGAPFVAEMGGAGNIAALDESLRAALDELGLGEVTIPANHFPTVAQQSTLLEAAGFRVEHAMWFPRPTPLQPGTTAADWTRQFRTAVWDAVPSTAQPALERAVDGHAEHLGLHLDDGWVADYCRLRFRAVAA